MRFLADECFDARIVSALRTDGHQVTFVVEGLAGSKDDALLELAHLDNRIVLTADKDFGELVYRLRKPAYGVILLLLDEVPIAEQTLLLKEVLATLGERLQGSFVVLRRGAVRLRTLQ